MVNWIPYEEALAIVTAQIGTSNPRGALDAAIERGAVTFNDALSAVRTFPGGLVVVDADQASGPDGVNRHELDKWIATLKTSAPSGRPVGTGKQTTDAILVQRMHALITAGKANSRTHAVRQILKEDGVTHGASAEASERRLRDLYEKTYGE